MDSFEHLRDDLYAYAADALPEGQKLKAEEHLRECAKCRSEMTEIRTLFERVKSAPGPSPEECPSIAGLLGLVLGRATARQSEHVDEHALLCSACRKAVTHLEARHEKEALLPQGMVYDYAADVMRPLAEAGIPGGVLLQGMEAVTITFSEGVSLGILAPTRTSRLAADSEAGFESCEFAAEDGTLKAYVEQFGQMLRVRLESNVKDLRRGLAVAVFQEGATARMSVPLAVEQGEGFGKLPVSAPGFHRPEREQYTVRVTFVRPPELVKALITYGVL